MTKSELIDRMCVLLGGRVAEEVIFKEISTGAQNDLARATDIARSMVKEYGMSEKLGHMTFEHNRKPLFLDIAPGFGTSKDYSEETAREIDNEVRDIVEHCYVKVKSTLTEKSGLLELVARTLLEKESIDGDELRTILKEHADGDHNNESGEKTDRPD